MSHKVIQVEERVPLLMNIPLSLQHLFAMFGATVLVPFLFKLNPNTCLFMNGVGTLLYIFLTKGKIPSYLGSSFAFISPVLLIMATHPSLVSGFQLCLHFSCASDHGDPSLFGCPVRFHRIRPVVRPVLIYS